PPKNILVLPVVFEGDVKGVLELASFEQFNPNHQAFLDQLTESIGIVINTIEANMRTENLLKQSQSLAHELQSRQQELQQTNQELQEKARLLAHQNEEVERKNQEVEQARQALEDKAKQLALTSKYKSEFLANMSHELRTPLNSLLILSDQLCKNQEGNLKPKQIEFSKTIHSSGNDLLMLINDILDLSKIESGTVAVDVNELLLDELENYVERTFRHMAESKNLDFLIRLDASAPKSVFTDAKRLQQIIKNLLSNAFKFTHRGQVTFSIEAAQAGWDRDNEELNRAPEVLAFSVTDTGIGISSDKQQIIFEAFQQADGSTSRKYGGTGLGLAISRELSRLLHGEIVLTSTPGKGSTFTLYLARTYAAPRSARKPAVADSAALTSVAIATAKHQGNGGFEVHRLKGALASPATPAQADPPILLNEAGDDRNNIHPGDQVLLIVENNLDFARFLLDTAREKGFKGLVTSQGAVALMLVREYHPTAITLDIFLSDIEGWRVLERLKNEISTRHIPVCIISTDDVADRALRYGALAFVPKPIQSKEVLDQLLDDIKAFIGRSKKAVLVVERDPAQLKLLQQYLGETEDLDLVPVPDGKVAVEMLAEREFDCLIVDPKMPYLAPLAKELERRGPNQSMAIVVYGGAGAKDGTWSRIGRTNNRLRRVHSFERLVDQTNLLLHRKVATLPAAQQQVVHDIYQSNKPLANKKVLIVDDDMRNIFALSSVLEDYAMRIVSADNGRDAINRLQEEPDIDMVLMDIMMPEMDGMDTIREIRKIPAGKGLPIIAVTAKAMKGDRDRCIEAGAWDYLSKPVDTGQLLAVLRAWLHR
ncbi:MAG: response regulator, partial [Burkholderiales bacterium]|nr:response regulator [Burkholderiales bacterium]